MKVNHMVLMLNIVSMMQESLAEVEVLRECLLLLPFWRKKLNFILQRVSRDQNTHVQFTFLSFGYTGI